MPKDAKKRRALHSRYGSSMEHVTNPGVVGVTILLPKLFELYPNIEFKFETGLKGTYYGHQDGKSCYLSTDKT
ncbi:hypothetical protein HYH02_011779 [Chlamydomonas schloesseri]|uniref:Uncharacterized protein n=1 Tax=Chlamydomonas schloesseri TaxID=2026947 RepID=A0A835T807_9CHLO|nr:hypothetical protein HYH02_011779 [Chlamydomonas schloesseri]|eukprot:KAG2435484.1 hypothetical protein HYH02_011779 [Chlamydomonas schloesseri]